MRSIYILNMNNGTCKYPFREEMASIISTYSVRFPHTFCPYIILHTLNMTSRQGIHCPGIYEILLMLLLRSKLGRPMLSRPSNVTKFRIWKRVLNIHGKICSLEKLIPVNTIIYYSRNMRGVEQAIRFP